MGALQFTGPIERDILLRIRALRGFASRLALFSKLPLSSFRARTTTRVLSNLALKVHLGGPPARQ